MMAVMKSCNALNHLDAFPCEAYNHHLCTPSSVAILPKCALDVSSPRVHYQNTFDGDVDDDDERIVSWNALWLPLALPPPSVAVPPSSFSCYALLTSSQLL